MKKNISQSAKYKGGQAVILAVLFFVVISGVVSVGVAGPTVRGIQTTNLLVKAKQGYALSEAGMEDVLYRIKNGLQVDDVETLVLDGQTVSTSISKTSTEQTVTSEGAWLNTIRRVETKLALGEGAAFNYAIQAGNGGFFIYGNSSVDGNVYSNGNIIGENGTIEGSASAASYPASSPVEANSEPTTPSNNLVFGSSNSTQDIAQSFRLSESGPLNKVSLYIKRTGSPSSVNVKLAFDDGGEPGTFISGVEEVLSSGMVGTSYGWVDIVFSNQVILQADTTYWLVLDKSNNSGSYTIGANSSYIDGTAKIGRGSSWNNTSPSGLDIYFNLYATGGDSKIEGVGGSWHLTVKGDSRANTVNRTDTYGTIYCQSGTGNASGKTCNTSEANPSSQVFPISDSMIESWTDGVDEAVSDSASWEQSGSLTVNWAGTTKNNPLKVNGNLTLNCNNDKPATFNKLHVTGNVALSSGCLFVVLGEMKIEGDLTLGSGILQPAATVLVQGVASVSGGGQVQLHSSYGTNSGIVLVEGRITIGGNGEFSGSGTSNSYPLLITTSTCPVDISCSGNPAISISGGSGAVVLIAPYGTLSMTGGTSARAMMAHRIEIGGGGAVNYDSGLADITFSSGPSGGWEIDSWKEVE